MVLKIYDKEWIEKYCDINTNGNIYYKKMDHNLYLDKVLVDTILENCEDYTQRYFQYDQKPIAWFFVEEILKEEDNSMYFI